VENGCVLVAKHGKKYATLTTLVAIISISYSYLVNPAFGTKLLEVIFVNSLLATQMATQGYFFACLLIPSVSISKPTLKNLYFTIYIVSSGKICGLTLHGVHDIEIV
jgi:hypothetical protein